MSHREEMDRLKAMLERAAPLGVPADMIVGKISDAVLELDERVTRTEARLSDLEARFGGPWS